MGKAKKRPWMGPGRKATGSDRGAPAEVPLLQRATALGELTANAMQMTRAMALAAVAWTEKTGFAGTPLEPTAARQHAAEELFFAVMKASSDFARAAVGPMRRAGLQAAPIGGPPPPSTQAARQKVDQMIANLVAPLPQDHPLRDKANELRAQLLANETPPGGGGEVPS